MVFYAKAFTSICAHCMHSNCEHKHTKTIMSSCVCFFRSVCGPDNSWILHFKCTYLPFLLLFGYSINTFNEFAMIANDRQLVEMGKEHRANRCHLNIFFQNFGWTFGLKLKLSTWACRCVSIHGTQRISIGINSAMQFQNGRLQQLLWNCLINFTHIF